MALRRPEEAGNDPSRTCGPSSPEVTKRSLSTAFISYLYYRWLITRVKQIHLEVATTHAQALLKAQLIVPTDILSKLAGAWRGIRTVIDS